MLKFIICLEEEDDFPELLKHEQDSCIYVKR